MDQLGKDQGKGKQPSLHPEKDDSPILQRAIRQLDSDVEALDAATLSALNRARLNALEQGQSARRWYWPAAAVAAALLLVMVYPPLNGQRDALYPDAAVSTLAELEASVADDGTLLDDEAFGMLQSLPGEDLALVDELDFVEWLDANAAQLDADEDNERNA